MYYNLYEQLLNNSLLNELEYDLLNLSCDYDYNLCHNRYNRCPIPSSYWYIYTPKKSLPSNYRSPCSLKRNCTVNSADSTPKVKNYSVKSASSQKPIASSSSVNEFPSTSKKETIPNSNETFSSKNKSPSDNTTKETFSPKLSINEDNTNYYIHLELPGIAKDQIKMEIDTNDRYIVISGERNTILNDGQNDNNSEDASEDIKEVGSTGKFEKIVSVPETGNLDTIQAKLDNGILKITIEKINKQVRKIHIQ